MYQILKKLLSAVLILPCVDIGATQLVEDADQGHVEVNISVKEQNRLSVKGRQIANVVPSEKGVLSYEKDEELGALYFALADKTASAGHGTVTLFVTDDQGTVYKLILVPRPIAGEDIILSPPAESVPSFFSDDYADGTASDYKRHIKDLVLVMDSPSLAPSFEPVVLNKEVPLWEEARFVLASKYIDRDLVGEKYLLTNISSSDMLLVEQELYRKGVRAISIEYHTLNPGDTTNIYIVRARNDNE